MIPPVCPSRLAAAAILALLASSAPFASAQTLVDPRLSVETVVSGLDRPTAMAFLGPDDFLFLEKDTGQVRRVLNGALQGGFVLDVPVSSNSERGLLGIAIAPGSPPRVFLFYTEAASQGGSALGNRVYRYDWNAGTAALENPLLVLDLPVLPGSNHDGGSLLLGPTGACVGVGNGSVLYAVIGDLNRNGQLENFPNGAPPDDTAVVFRVCQDGSPAPGNPFTPYCSATTTTICGVDGDCPGGESCITEVARYWAYGIRNSFGLALDPVSGLLWDTENGPNVYDEVNALPAGTNSGWQTIMGPDPEPSQVGNLFDVPGAGSTYSDPEFSWLSPIAVTGIVFPVGGALGAGFDDVVLVGDYLLGQIYAFPLNTARDAFDLSGFTGVGDLVASSSAERNQFLFGSGFGPNFGGVTSLTLGPDGALYVVSIGNNGQSNGAIFRVSGPGVPALGHLGLSLLVVALLGTAICRLRPYRPR